MSRWHVQCTAQALVGTQQGALVVDVRWGRSKPNQSLVSAYYDNEYNFNIDYSSLPLVAALLSNQWTLMFIEAED